MTGQLKEVFGIYENDRRQQGAGKIVVEIMTKADHAAMHELARLDIERIAQAAGAAMPKNACIVARRSVRQQQETGIKQLNEMLQEIKGAESKAEAIKRGLFAAGYVNGMYCGDLMSKSEMHDAIKVIDQTFTKTELRFKTARRPFLGAYRKGGESMSAQEYRRIIAVDFDGTLAETKFPEIIKPIPKMIRHCKQLQRGGAILILNTCRKGKDLQDAVEWCAAHGLVFDYVNENTAENIANCGGTDTRKIFAHEYIDDKAINPVREAMWARRVRQLYAQRIISAVGLAAALVIAIEAALAFIK